MDDLVNLVVQHKWVAIAALAIGFLTRLCKSDTTFPVDIPTRWRVWLALALGVGSGVLEKISQGTPWKDALLGGLSAAVAAIVTHNVVVDSLRGGKEFAVPGMTKPGVPPGPGKPPSLPPPSMGPDDDDDDDGDMEDTARGGKPLVPRVALAIGLLTLSCNAKTVNDIKTYTADALAVVDYLCVLDASLEIDSPDAIAKICHLDQQFAPVIEQLLRKQAESRAKFMQKSAEASGIIVNSPQMHTHDGGCGCPR